MLTCVPIWNDAKMNYIIWNGGVLNYPNSMMLTYVPTWCCGGPLGVSVQISQGEIFSTSATQSTVGSFILAECAVHQCKVMQNKLYLFNLLCTIWRRHSQIAWEMNFEPIMFTNFTNGDPLHWVNNQHSWNQIPCCT